MPNIYKIFIKLSDKFFILSQNWLGEITDFPGETIQHQLVKKEPVRIDFLALHGLHTH